MTIQEHVDRRCPECGCTLLDNGTHVWCSFVGSQRAGGEKACDFGIRELVRSDDPRIEPPPAMMEARP